MAIAHTTKNQQIRNLLMCLFTGKSPKKKYPKITRRLWGKSKSVCTRSRGSEVQVLGVDANSHVAW